jgi:hypothetical protein
MGQLRTYASDATSKTIMNTVDRFVGDFGVLEVIPTAWLAKFTSAAANIRRGYILDSALIDLVWKQMPQVKPLEDQGGGPRFLVDGIVGLRVYNPRGLGAVTSTS